MSYELHRRCDVSLRAVRDAHLLRADRLRALSTWESDHAWARSALEDLRRRELWDRERELIGERMTGGPDALDGRNRPLVVVAHADDWTAAALRAGLLGHGWEVIDTFGDAAATVAELVVRQPELLVTSDRLLGGDGLAVVARSATLAPSCAASCRSPRTPGATGPRAPAPTSWCRTG